MSKIKDLLADREKLAKYEELTAVLDLVKSIGPNHPISIGINGGCNVRGVSFETIQIIVSALEAEIKKLDEE